MTETPLWQNRNFRLMFASAAATNMGDGLIAVAVAWLATLLTHDPMLIGLVATARNLPWFLFALPAGVITDRIEHRRLIVGADCLRVAITLALLALALTAHPGTIPVLVMAALSFVLGSAEVLRDNTAQTFTPSVVDKLQLEQANGAMWSAEKLTSEFIAPPLAGLLIGISIALPFAIQAAMLLAAILLIGNIRLPRRVQTAPHLPLRAALREGMLWLWRDVPLRRLAFILGGFNFIGYGFAAVLILYGQRVLGLDAVGFGLFLTLAAIGGLAATLAGPRLLRHITPRTAILLGMAGFTVTALILALNAPLWLVAVFMVLDGFSGMLWNIAQVSYRQRHIPAPLLGRVNSAFRFIGTGPAAFGAFTFGWLISWAGSGADAWGSAEAVLLPYWAAAAIGGALTLYATLRLHLR
ncbi:MAG: MFS transporter [Pseudorhodobacter sp. PARRP1]|nr:MAG: MFS transporter [Pseudorhodobacter sp. PARRP1]